MPRHSKTLNEYNTDQEIDIEFDYKTSHELVGYICNACKKPRSTQKRIIMKQLNQNKPLICINCKNKSNRNK